MQFELSNSAVIGLIVVLLSLSAMNVIVRKKKSRYGKKAKQSPITFEDLEGEMKRSLSQPLAGFGVSLISKVQGSNARYDEITEETIDRIRSYDYVQVMPQSNYKRVYDANKDEVDELLEKLKKDIGVDLEELTHMHTWSSEAQAVEVIITDKLAEAIDTLESQMK